MENALQMPSLGRPFSLGMLYDCRDDRLIPGVALWNHSILQSALDCRPQESSQFSVIAEDSIESKTSSLGVEAGLKLIKPARRLSQRFWISQILRRPTTIQQTSTC